MSRALLASILLSISLLGTTTSASADRFTFGIALGRSDLKAENDTASSRTVFGRIRVRGRLSVQGEVERSTEVGGSMTVRRLAGAGRLDLGSAGARVMPYGLLGLAAERLDFDWGVRDYLARELGGGLDYQATKQLVIGVELRAGEREESNEGAWCELECFYPVLADRYVSARLTLGLKL